MQCLSSENRINKTLFTFSSLSSTEPLEFVYSNVKTLVTQSLKDSRWRQASSSGRFRASHNLVGSKCSFFIKRVSNGRTDRRK